MTKLILIDGNAILHRAYHALPSSLTSTSGEPINAVYGFVSILINLIQNQKPTHITVAFDTPVETLRKAQYVGYQAHRPRLDSDLSSQFELTYKVLESMNIPIYKKERYEADDVIGTITAQVKDKIDEVVIVTGDRDILQLVNDKNKVRVYMPIQGLNKAKLYEEADVIERMEVKASQIVDYKALAGDSSDNYPGVPGVGEKSAIKLLKEYDNLENIYKNLGNIPERISKKLAIGIESAGMSQSLARIVCDVPITYKLDEAGKWSINSEKVLSVFAEIGFKTLTKRVQQLSLI
jgi:DNA polymerase I